MTSWAQLDGSSLPHDVSWGWNIHDGWLSAASAGMAGTAQVSLGISLPRGSPRQDSLTSLYGDSGL